MNWIIIFGEVCTAFVLLLLIYRDSDRDWLLRKRKISCAYCGALRTGKETTACPCSVIIGNYIVDSPLTRRSSHDRQTMPALR